MVRLLHLSTTAILLSAIALASPLPQDGGPTTNQVTSETTTTTQLTTESTVEPITFVYGSGNRRTTSVVYTTYTTILYTTFTTTNTLTPQGTLSNPDEPRLTPGTISITQSFAPPFSANITSSAISSSTFTNTSAITFANSTTSILTTALNTTSSTASFANTTTVLNSATSSTLSTNAQNTSFTSSATTTAILSTTCRPPAIAPAPTNEGTVDGCTLWYVAQTGDYCYTVAQQFGISVVDFMDWNPSVLAPSCSRMIAGDAYCVQVCLPSSSAVSSLASTPVTSSILSSSLAFSSVASSISTLSTTTTTDSATSTLSPLDVYRSYNGDGTAAQGWPTEDQWVTFDYMFIANTPQMRTSCAQWGVPDNSIAEQAILREQILSVGADTGVDPRFILAIIMQESTGCVRVITTAWSHPNPGAMQSYNGTGTCNENNAPLGLPGVAGNGLVQTPCPESEIRQQILDGTNGTIWGPGLVQDLEEQGATDSSRFYRAARLYNGGAIVEDNLALPCCTASYASDIANRLTGWVKAPRTFVPNEARRRYGR